ncbi:hypothetical protein [Chromobacterium haemolyticum]|uniref:hypothetical protein n=1 Tax=Chromobacterium haemolyticum TaxID=394935 RepID=UPI0024467FEB|nr:hypothetical protein [Chromobacterium haemolyticum]MDH0342076.1 hypothetical protein [Chromobacterium haemolyticum]
MFNRTVTAKIIRFSIVVIASVTLLQAARFCFGEIGSPIIALFEAAYGPSNKMTASSSPLASLFSWIGQVYYYLAGIGGWVAPACLVVAIGSAIARIVEVGLKQYMAECKAAQDESQRLAKLEKRRAEREARKTQKSKPGFGFGTLLLGIIIGKMF